MEINAGSYVYSTSRLNCNSWRIWFRTAISLKFDSFPCTDLSRNMISQYFTRDLKSENLLSSVTCLHLNI